MASAPAHTPSFFRQCLDLFNKGLTEAEIAHRLHTTVANVRSTLFAEVR